MSCYFGTSNNIITRLNIMNADIFYGRRTRMGKFASRNF